MKYFNSRPTLLRNVAIGAVVIATICAIPSYLLVEPPLEPLPQETGGNRQPGLTMSVTFNGVEVRPAIEQIFAIAHQACKIDPSLQGTVRLSLQNEDFESALHSTLAQVEGTYRVERGVYIVTARKSIPAAILNAPNSPWWSLADFPAIKRPGTPNATKPVTAKFEKTDLREALRNLFRQSRNSFSIDAQVQGSVSLTLKKVSFDYALKRVLQQAKCTFRVKDGVYLVTRN